VPKLQVVLSVSVSVSSSVTGILQPHHASRSKPHRHSPRPEPPRGRAGVRGAIVDRNGRARSPGFERAGISKVSGCPEIGRAPLCLPSDPPAMREPRPGRAACCIAASPGELGHSGEVPECGRASAGSAAAKPERRTSREHIRHVRTTAPRPSAPFERGRNRRGAG
jgi:hypothetical protein